MRLLEVVEMTRLQFTVIVLISTLVAVLLLAGLAYWDYKELF